MDEPLRMKLLESLKQPLGYHSDNIVVNRILHGFDELVQVEDPSLHDDGSLKLVLFYYLKAGHYVGMRLQLHQYL